MLSDELKAEARSFDERLAERMRHGHIPDLRRVEPCDWFYNNPWRRPYLVDMDVGRAFRFALKHSKPHQLLEVGSGAGQMSLEFARHGFHVTGLEIGAGCIDVAERLAAENPFRECFGSLRYVNDDFLDWDAPDNHFDTICFFGSLHHFAAVDRVIEKSWRLLRPGGRLCVLEPARDWPRQANGAMIALIRLLLGVRHVWYEPRPLPQTEEEFTKHITICLNELCEGRDVDEDVQSPHDNSSAAETMLINLRSQFTEIECLRLNGFLQRVIGGVRGESEEETQRLATFLDVVDRVSVQIGMIQPADMYWAGEKA